MQIKALPYPLYRRLPIDDSTPQQAIQRWEKLRLYDRLRRQGCSQKLALEAIGWSRSTYYRWRKRFHTSGLDGLVARSRCPRRLRSPQWSFQDERLVWQMRRRYPLLWETPLAPLFAARACVCRQRLDGRSHPGQGGAPGPHPSLCLLPGTSGPPTAPQLPERPRSTLALRHEGLPARPTGPDRPLQGLPPARGPSSRSSRPSVPSASTWSCAAILAPPLAMPPASSRPSSKRCPFPSLLSKSTADRSSGPSSRPPATNSISPSMCCPHDGPSTTAVSNGRIPPPAVSSGPSTTGS